MKILIKVLVLLFFSTCAVWAVEEKTNIRVGISNNSFSSYEHKSAVFVSNGLLSVIDASGGQKEDVGAYSDIKVSIENGLFTVNSDSNDIIQNSKGPIVITGPSGVGIKDLKRKGTPAYYAGMIELKKVKEDKFNIINVLTMQEYLKGVVPNEMPVSFGFEALKAQATAARNYANRADTPYQNYDVCDSTACQVYYGENSRTSISDRAVDETEGIYALYNNEIILALYSSTPSGITENYFDTFGNGIEHKPYLVSVKDSEELKKLKDEDDIKEYFKEKPPSFDMNSPRYRWERTFNRFELEEILSKTLAEQSKTGAVTPVFDSTKGFWGLEDIKVLSRGDSYKALEIEIKSSSGDYIVKKELPIRRLFKQNGQILSSANFSVEKEYEKLTKEEKKELKRIERAAKISEDENEPVFKSEEAAEKKEEIKLLPSLEVKKVYKTKFGRDLPSSFTFYGAGFGHGVGMSQYGAGFLSSYGVDYENILKHYYKGISLGTIKKSVLYNEAGINYVQEFYFNKKNKIKGNFENPSKSPLKKEINKLLENKKPVCYLTIENPNRISKIEFYINDYYFSPDTSSFNKKIIVSDITKFLVDGKNKIIFKPLNEKDKKKSAAFYLTFGEINE